MREGEAALEGEEALQDEAALEGDNVLQGEDALQGEEALQGNDALEGEPPQLGTSNEEEELDDAASMLDVVACFLFTICALNPSSLQLLVHYCCKVCSTPVLSLAPYLRGAAANGSAGLSASATVQGPTETEEGGIEEGDLAQKALEASLRPHASSATTSSAIASATTSTTTSATTSTTARSSMPAAGFALAGALQLQPRESLAVQGLNLPSYSKQQVAAAVSYVGRRFKCVKCKPIIKRTSDLSNISQVLDEATCDGIWVEEQTVLELLLAEGVDINHEDVEDTLRYQATRQRKCRSTLIRIALLTPRLQQLMLLCSRCWQRDAFQVVIGDPRLIRSMSDDIGALFLMVAAPRRQGRAW